MAPRDRTCRSCGATIEWAVTPKGSRIPLDVERTPRGNIRLSADGVVTIVEPGLGNRMSHFVTCPNADRHRRKDKAR